jgi:hypothetical protein
MRRYFVNSDGNMKLEKTKKYLNLALDSVPMQHQKIKVLIKEALRHIKTIESKEVPVEKKTGITEQWKFVPKKGLINPFTAEGTLESNS